MQHGETNHLDKILKLRELFEYSAPKITPSFSSNIVSVNNDKMFKTIESDYLVEFSDKSQSYCVGCVDIVNSTIISARLSSPKLSEYYEIFLNSMSKIIGSFKGKVIKNVGDCLLYYFPICTDSISDGLTNCLDCGMMMLDARPIICQILTSRKLPDLSYRISADFGSVLIMNTTESSSIDLIGPPVNMCTKINHCASNNEFVIGGDFYEVARKFSTYKLLQANSCNIGFKQSYPVYKVVSHTAP